MNHVLDLLNKNNITYTESAKDYVVRCLNPEHQDKNPSLRIDKVTGKMHCFSCGYKRDIFSHFGILGNPVSIKVAKLKEKIMNIKTAFIGAEFPDEMVPFNRAFRGISAATLRHFGAFYTNSKKEVLNDRIFFPIKDMTGKAAVFLGRHTLSDGNPRYLLYPTGAQVPLYPEILAEPTTSIILVEGIFDLLNLYDKGLKNVCCTFGTNTLDKTAASKILPLKVQGITKFYIMFDGDTPGKSAAIKVKNILQELNFEVEIIELEDGKDPGDLSLEEVESIKEYISEISK